MQEEEEDLSFCKKLKNREKKGSFGRSVVRVRIGGRCDVDGC
jgi:hypothetical protein